MTTVKRRRRPRRLPLIIALVLLFCVVIWVFFSKSAIVIAKVAIGDGGVLRFVGTVCATNSVEAMEYEAFFGKARYSCEVDMHELLLLAKEDTSFEHGFFDEVLLGHDGIHFPNGLLYMKCPFGTLPMTCLSKVDCAKALGRHSLGISHAFGTNSFALSFLGDNGGHQEIIFAIPDMLWQLISYGERATNTNNFGVAQACSNNVDIVIAARAQIGVTTNYVAAYRKISYPNGDIPRGEGVCSDVVVRALRDSRNIDLQELIHIDMRANFWKYPRKRKWMLVRPDSNIDHRRVLNQECFFTRQGWSVQVTTNRNDYLPGDLVTCRVFGLPHIMIVSDRKARDGTPLVIHNIGGGTQEKNALFSYQLTGHFRIPQLAQAQRE